MGAGNVTYQNVESQRRELLDVSLAWIITCLEQRLSMNDVTPRGTVIRLDTEAFTRGVSEERWRTYQRAFSIVDETTGERALSIDEIRNRETFTPPGAQVATPNDASALTSPAPAQPAGNGAQAPAGAGAGSLASPRLRGD